MINNGEAFDMSFGGEDIHVPAGKFSCSIEALAYHIVATATKWNFNVEITDSSDLSAKPAAAIKAEPVIAEKTAEEIKEVRKEEEIKNVKEEVKKDKKSSTLKDKGNDLKSKL